MKTWGIMSLTMNLLIGLLLSTNSLIISIIKKNKVLGIISGAINLFIVIFILFLVFILIPSM